MNREYLLNTVDPTKETSQFYSYLGIDPKKAKLKVLFIGNSITLHEPQDDLGWYKCCGMAASETEKDYVHLLLNKLGDTSSFLITNLAKWEHDYTNIKQLDELKILLEEYKPDITIIRIGENANPEYVKQGFSFGKHFEELVSLVNQYCNKMVATTLFWRWDDLSNQIAEVAKKYNVRLADITPVGDDDKCKALGQYWHEGVALHPNDLGMQKIADLIYDSMKEFIK